MRSTCYFLQLQKFILYFKNSKTLKTELLLRVDYKGGYKDGNKFK